MANVFDGSQPSACALASAVQDPANLSPKASMRRIEELKENPRNARTHSKAQIARSMERFGFTNPILIDDSGTVLAGHRRLSAAKQLGMSLVPVIVLSHLTEAEKRAYVLVDNKIA